MELPEPRNFGWDLKNVDKAFSKMAHLSDGRAVFEIDHQPVREVTAEMLAWWYGVCANLTLVIDGETYPAYRVSHPRDHVSFERAEHAGDRPLAAGDHVNIVEAYKRKAEFLVREQLEVVALDETQFCLRATRAGITVAHLSFFFEDGEDGLQVRNLLTVGLEKGLLKPLVNRLLIPWLYSEDKNYAWMRHSVEEIGNFENFLPEIFARRDQGMTICWDRNSPQAGTHRDGPFPAEA